MRVDQKQKRIVAHPLGVSIKQINGVAADQQSTTKHERRNAVIVALAFPAPVPGTIVVLGVAGLIAGGVIVLVVISDQIVESVSVVRSDEIHTRVRPPALVLVKIGAAGQSIRDFSDKSFVAPPK